MCCSFFSACSRHEPQARYTARKRTDKPRTKTEHKQEHTFEKPCYDASVRKLASKQRTGKPPDFSIPALPHGVKLGPIVRLQTGNDSISTGVDTYFDLSIVNEDKAFTVGLQTVIKHYGYYERYSHQGTSMSLWGSVLYVYTALADGRECYLEVVMKTSGDTAYAALVIYGGATLATCATTSGGEVIVRTGSIDLSAYEGRTLALFLYASGGTTTLYSARLIYR